MRSDVASVGHFDLLTSQLEFGTVSRPATSSAIRSKERNNRIEEFHRMGSPHLVHARGNDGR